MSLRVSIVAFGVVAVLSACYSPELRDCAVRCSPGGACADGLECGDDGYCHTPGSTDMCELDDGGNGTDADSADASGADADPDRPDADPTANVPLNLTASGPGRIQVPSHSLTCNSDCQYMFPSGTQVMLMADPNNMNVTFDAWTGDACVGEPADCTFALSAPTSITATFSN